MTSPEAAESLEEIFVNLHTPVSSTKQEECLVPDHPTKMRGEPDLEANGEGLLMVDLLNLPKTFSWRRYRIDLMGLLAAVALVALLMSVLVLISRVLCMGC
jgi:hypothetical protein